MGGFGTPLAHHMMLRDTVRVMAYRAAIFAHARDQVVLDLGCGTGILSVFAALAGARKVYAVESSAVATVARLLARANGVGERVEVIRGDSRQVNLPERATLVVHELLGGDPFAEGLLPVLADARARLAANNARFLPLRIDVACVGCEPPSLPLLGDRLQREAEALGKLYGLDLSPYALALEAGAEAIALSAEQPAASAAPLVLTDECPLFSLDCSAAATSPREVSARMRANAPGRLGTVALFFSAQLDEHTSLSTSPFAPRTHWGLSLRELPAAVRVEPGQQISLRARIEPIDGCDRVVVELD